MTRILTGIDLPLAPSCGSMILTDDLYRDMSGHMVEFLALPGDQTWASGFDRVTDLRTDKTGYGPDFEAYVEALTREVAAVIGARRPDVIHAQHLGFGLSSAFARLEAAIPLVAIAHGTDVIEAQRSEQAHDALRAVVAAATAVVAPTEFMAGAINDLTGGRFRDRITLAPWGIPRERLGPPARFAFRRNLKLLHAGRLDANKGTHVALEALARADHDHHLTVIGDGPERGRLEAAARALGLADRVVFEPFLPRQELWARFCEFDAFVMTTEYVEAFGLVAIEAQAHRLPVVYSTVAGLVDVLGDSALPHTPGDGNALARCLNHLAYDLDARQRLAKAGQAHAGRYTMRALADRVTEVTAAALTNPRPQLGPPRRYSPAETAN